MKKPLYISKEITKAVLNVTIFLLLPLVVFTLITSKTDIIGGIKSFTVLTGSMSPLIPAGSIVYSMKKSDYQKGDIITFDQGGVNVTHRIVERITDNNKVSYLTRGDANNSTDSQPVTAESVVGKVELFVPEVGKLTMFLKTLPGFMLLIIIPALIFVGFELFNIKKELEKEIEKKVINRMHTNG